MKDKEYIALQKMIEYINKALLYTKGYTFEEFCNDSKTVDATVFIISQVGELVKNITEHTKNKYTNIEWNMINGLRNRIVHDYEGIMLKSVWRVIKVDIVELKAEIQNIIETEQRQYIEELC